MAENNKQFDYNQLDEEQMEALRAQLRGFSTGVKGSLRAVQSVRELQDAVASHSSHSDSDGWI
jgi:hypothetical protein